MLEGDMFISSNMVPCHKLLSRVHAVGLTHVPYMSNVKFWGHPMVPQILRFEHLRLFLKKKLSSVSPQPKSFFCLYLI